MFKLIFLLVMFVCCVFFWQDISPYFQAVAQKIDGFMLDMNSLLNKVLSVVNEQDNVLDELQDQDSSPTTE